MTSILYRRSAHGIDTIAEYAKQFGLRQETGVELPSNVSASFRPRRGSRRRNQPWYPGETISAAIGTGICHRDAAADGQRDRDGGERRRVDQAAPGTGGDEPYDWRSGRVSTDDSRESSGQAGDPCADQISLADVVTKGTATRAKSPRDDRRKTGTAQTAALRTGPEKDIPKKFRDHVPGLSRSPRLSRRVSLWRFWPSTWGMVDRLAAPWPRMSLKPA